MTCGVCIATYRRPDALATCLAALAAQTEPPDEIVVSDAGGDDAARDVTASFRGARAWTVRHCATSRSALPWQRWWAFRHSRASIVLFIDDDVRLMPEALARLRRAYRDVPAIAGAGFPIVYDGEDLPAAAQTNGNGHARGGAPATLRERWLGIHGLTPGSVTAGGINVDLPAPLCASDRGASCRDVDWLSGGAMSFRRDVLDAVGPLERLFDLYDARIGKAEDAVLSSRARAHGRLLLIDGVHARHPALHGATRTANPQDGFRKGLLETWGRAHVLRWLARDGGCAARAWCRVASLELARAAKALLRDPRQRSRWQRLAGDLVGIGRTVVRWRTLAAGPGPGPDARSAHGRVRRVKTPHRAPAPPRAQAQHASPDDPRI